MKLTFLGTRGEIPLRTPRHHMHTSLLVEYRGRSVMIDCGADWIDAVHELRPQAIAITHAHPDHAFGLQEGAPCPVYATEETWDRIGMYPVVDRETLRPRQPVMIHGMAFEAFPVEHSLRAPAVGYRVTAGRVVVFYCPDVVFIREREAALAGVRIYIGDGATLSRSFVRRRGDALLGHTPVRTQLTWCAKEGVSEAIFTHCGSEIVGGDERELTGKIAEWAGERGVTAEIAYDGMERVLR